MIRATFVSFKRLPPSDLLFVLFVSAVFGSVTLPLFPFWGALIICLSLSLVYFSYRNSIVLASSLAIYISLSLPYLSNWLAAFVNEPLLLAKNSLLFSNGLPLGEVETSLLYVALAAPTVSICYLNLKSHARWFYLFVLLATASLALHTFAPVLNYTWPQAVQTATANKIQQLLLLASASPYAYKQIINKQVFLSAIIGASALIAGIILLQIIFRDYSYVLTSNNIEDYFYRVRASYYYHAPFPHL